MFRRARTPDVVLCCPPRGRLRYTHAIRLWFTALRIFKHSIPFYTAVALAFRTLRARRERALPRYHGLPAGGIHLIPNVYAHLPVTAPTLAHTPTPTFTHHPVCQVRRSTHSRAGTISLPAPHSMVVGDNDRW